MSKVQNLSVTLDNIKFCPYSSTFRLLPGNYWLASFRNNTVEFDSWDGVTQEIFEKHPNAKAIVLEFVEAVKKAINDELIDFMTKKTGATESDSIKYLIQIFSDEVNKISNNDGGYSLALHILSSNPYQEKDFNSITLQTLNHKTCIRF